ncbi:MAG TPA: RsmE family RNA methyltransferase [Kiritimatiellia bacterium]|nr:RsmE family RNA methyltransferase [Kiritimatiellia bacterium]
MRCFIEPERWSPERIEVEGEELHHLAHVIRAREGDLVEVTDGVGHEARTRLVHVERRVAWLEVEQQSVVPAPRPAITLVQALPREQKFEWVIQKATELGVSAIYPALAEHSVVKLRKGEEQAKRDRWRKIAINALKQSGGAWLPDVHPAADVGATLAGLPRHDLVVVCSLAADAQPLRSVLRDVRDKVPRSVVAVVGPEGDFTSRETSVARNAGARLVSLGSRVLRAETAALYILSALTYEFSPVEPRS